MRCGVRKSTALALALPSASASSFAAEEESELSVEMAEAFRLRWMSALGE
jgi:hypothetical protein